MLYFGSFGYSYELSSAISSTILSPKQQKLFNFAHHQLHFRNDIFYRVSHHKWGKFGIFFNIKFANLGIFTKWHELSNLLSGPSSVIQSYSQIHPCLVLLVVFSYRDHECSNPLCWPVFNDYQVSIRYFTPRMLLNLTKFRRVTLTKRHFMIYQTCYWVYMLLFFFTIPLSLGGEEHQKKFQDYVFDELGSYAMIGGGSPVWQKREMRSSF